MVLNTEKENNSSKKTSKGSVDFAKLCALAAQDKKAEEIVVLDVSQLTSYADFIVICSGLSERQTQAIARHVEVEMAECGQKAIGVEGYAKGHWILLDYGDVVFHVFSEEARQYYDLDGVWADAKKTRLHSDISSAERLILQY